MPPRQQVQIDQRLREHLSSPDVSATEWWLVIGALGMIDLIQVGIDLLVIGEVLNRFLDLFVDGSIWLYLHIRAPQVIEGKQITTLLLSFVSEEIPILDALPAYCLDGLYYYSVYKSMKELEKVPGSQKIVNKLNKAGSTIGGKPTGATPPPLPKTPPPLPPSKPPVPIDRGRRPFNTDAARARLSQYKNNQDEEEKLAA